MFGNCEGQDEVSKLKLNPSETEVCPDSRKVDTGMCFQCVLDGETLLLKDQIHSLAVFLAFALFLGGRWQLSPGVLWGSFRWCASCGLS